MVTNLQLYLAIGIPLLFNASLMTVLFALQNSRLDAKFEALESKFEARFAALEARIGVVEAKLDALLQIWRSELRRVEEVIDARLKHLEQR